MSARSISSSSTASTAVLEEENGPSSGRASILSNLVAILNPLPLLLAVVHFFYRIYQRVLSDIFSPPYVPRVEGTKPFGRVAIVGGGLTGVSSAAHLVAHGFEVVIYEAEESIGGIWARVNSTSSLQLNSLLYRFHPSILWSCGFPQRNEIVSQIELLWKRYHLESSTRLNTKVTRISRHNELSTDPAQGGHAHWVINDGSEGAFDAVIMAIGTCGPPKMAEIRGQDTFHGKVLHSSSLDDAELKGKKVVIIGSGASGVEAAELAVGKGAKQVVVLARDDKWIIPRNTVFDVLLALQPFGKEMPLSFIPECIIRTFHYRDLKSLSPRKKGLFQGTPIVNDEFLAHVRAGLITYKRGDTQSITPRGIKFNERPRESSSGDAGIQSLQTADVIVMATGFAKPSIDMLPKDLFPTEGGRSYERPNLYLQNFCTEDYSLLLTNASYMDAIGTVGNWHIGLYTRVLMVFLLDKNARPSPNGMKLWVDLVNWVKTKTFGERDTSGLAFFTYTELVIWIVTFHFFRISRIPWLFFVLFGWGVRGPGAEEKARVKAS